MSLLHETVPQQGASAAGSFFIAQHAEDDEGSEPDPYDLPRVLDSVSRYRQANRSSYEHECLSRILEAMLTVDHLNAPCLQAAELLGRRMQVIREAHRISFFRTS